MANYIDQVKKEGKIGSKPLLVLNGEMITYDALKKCDLVLFRKDIDSVQGIFQKEDEGALHIYGEAGRNGVLLIAVKKHKMVCD
ncbi:hypothetical protein POV27_07635 [Aureisphaera galaxeae]|uniref:hypothetical protein n=1 Tax=Aureisphaera galaxeae TaxID=1538023 RepID=UPI00234FC0BE|nr:hypothetical protein [Aureisphaera galaxeae]MDC8003919.1 hypothetical protein [Aureisphaera galaxeae]